jgi:hypothetical protein
MGLGVSLFVMGMLGGVLVLREGVTGLVGEGDRLPPESTEQVCRRLAILAGLLGAVASGWMLARLGGAYQHPAPRRPCVARLAAELLMLLGGVGLATGVLVWCGPQSVGYNAPEMYRQLGITAGACGLGCLGLGWVLFRKWRDTSTLPDGEMVSETNNMRPLGELIDLKEPAWPLVQQWMAEASTDVEVLPAERAAAEAALHALQVTTRSPMGAIAYQAAGLLIDSGWLRVLGAGGHPRFQRSLPGWNAGRSSGYLLVADDAVGGSFALNGGAFGNDKGNVYYYSPDALQWEPCEFGYSQFLAWVMSDALREFYDSLRWDGWQAEVKVLTADQALNFYPFLFAEGPPLQERSRRPGPVAEQYELQLDIQRQLEGP